MPTAIDQLIRSRRMTIALIVQPDGRLLVRAPLRMTESRIQEFVEAHSDWVTRNQVRARLSTPPPVHCYETGEPFAYLGQFYPLTIVPRQRPALTFDGRCFRLARSTQPKAEQAFTRWYRQQALEVMTERVEAAVKQFGFSYQKIRISSARTRWGSCSSRGTLSFTYRLVMAPPDVVDYVILHELVHTQVRNHSRTFWGRVASLMPDYKRRMAWLKKNGQRLA